MPKVKSATTLRRLGRTASPRSPLSRALTEMQSRKKALYVPIAGTTQPVMNMNANRVRSQAFGFAKRHGFRVATRLGLHPKTRKVVLGIYPR